MTAGQQSSDVVETTARDPCRIVRGRFVGVITADVESTRLAGKRRRRETTRGNEIEPDTRKRRRDPMQVVSSAGMADQNPCATLNAMDHVEHGVTWRPWRRWRNERLQPDQQIARRRARHQ